MFSFFLCWQLFQSHGAALPRADGARWERQEASPSGCASASPQIGIRCCHFCSTYWETGDCYPETTIWRRISLDMQLFLHVMPKKKSQGRLWGGWRFAKNDSEDPGVLSQENSSEELASRDRDARLTHRGASEYNASPPLSFWFYFGDIWQFWTVQRARPSLSPLKYFLLNPTCLINHS